MAAHLCAPCTLCGHGCGEFWCPDDRPSPLFSTFSVVLNLAYFIWALIVVSTESCESETLTWAILGLLTALVNIGFAFYLYFRFASKARKDGISTGNAACSLFMYDWGVCVYILFLVWIIVWMVLAGMYQNDASSDDQCGRQLIVGIIFFICYLVIGAFMIALSLFTECCKEPSWRVRAVRSDPHQGGLHGQQQQQPKRGLVSGLVHGLFGGGGNHPQQQQSAGNPNLAPQRSVTQPHTQQQQFGQPHYGAPPPPRNPNFQA